MNAAVVFKNKRERFEIVEQPQIRVWMMLATYLKFKDICTAMMKVCFERMHREAIAKKRSLYI